MVPNPPFLTFISRRRGRPLNRDSLLSKQSHCSQWPWGSGLAPGPGLDPAQLSDTEVRNGPCTLPSSSGRPASCVWEQAHLKPSSLRKASGSSPFSYPGAFDTCGTPVVQFTPRFSCLPRHQVTRGALRSGSCRSLQLWGPWKPHVP